MNRITSTSPKHPVRPDTGSGTPAELWAEAATGASRPALVGRSLAMRRLLAQIDRVAPSLAGVLIRGETGTGKDAVAQRIHAGSPRGHGPFVVIDCSALSPALAESELFGHERGSFTGAQTARAGLFEEADGGTVFLDELGELPKELQPKLLRVLEQRVVRRVGGSKQVPVDVRVICATHRDLRAEVARGCFREDLYYRVAAITLEVPALRERLDDVPLLIEHFMRQEGADMGAHELPESTLSALANYGFPGNVRELRNVVQRLMMTPTQPFGEGTLPGRADHGPPPFEATPEHCFDFASTMAPREPQRVDDVPELRTARRDCMSAFERAYLIRVLESTDHNVTRAARVAGVSRQMIQRMMGKHRIKRTVSLS